MEDSKQPTQSSLVTWSNPVVLKVGGAPARGGRTGTAGGGRGPSAEKEKKKKKKNSKQPMDVE